MSDLEKEVKALRQDVDRLKSKDQILQQLTRYGRGQEWLDVSLLNEVFFEDAYIDFGFFRGVWSDYRPFLMKIESAGETSFHLCASAQVEFDGDDKAYVECYGVAGGQSKGETNVFGGRYLHTFERRQGVWKSARCVFLLDWHIEQHGGSAVGGELANINVVTDRSPKNPLFRRMGIDVT